ncbi:unnamed protein product, partial [Tenebrio molitor]
MASHQSFDQRGKILHSQARKIIAFIDHQELTIPIVNYKQRVIANNGISEKMYKTIVKESKPAGASTSSTPRKKRPHKKQHELVEVERNHLAFEEVSNENWAAVCTHVKKVEQDYTDKEPMLDGRMDEFIPHVNTASSDEEEKDFDD